MREALLRYQVEFFRDQDITRVQHIAFARAFGELEIHPAAAKDQPDSEVLRIAHGPDSKGNENNWHSDVTWRAQPSLGSILGAIELPGVGGDTLFANMVMAYSALDEKMQQGLCQLTAVHDIARVFTKRLGRDAASLHEKYPPREHPVIRRYPEPGRRLIYVNIASDYFPAVCTMERVTIAGDKPYFQADVPS